MDIRVFLLCVAAQDLARMHGTFFAAAFLAEKDVSIDLALAALSSTVRVDRSPNLRDGHSVLGASGLGAVLANPISFAFAPSDDDT